MQLQTTKAVGEPSPARADSNGRAARTPAPRQVVRMLGIASAAVAGLTLIDALATRGRRAVARGISAHRRTSIEVTRTIVVERPIGEVYAFWRDFQNFPRFM